MERKPDGGGMFDKYMTRYIHFVGPELKNKETASFGGSSRQSKGELSHAKLGGGRGGKGAAPRHERVH